MEGVRKKNVLSLNNDAFHHEGVAGGRKIVNIALNTLVLKFIKSSNWVISDWIGIVAWARDAEWGVVAVEVASFMGVGRSHKKDGKLRRRKSGRYESWE